ncbi:hypothetical protein NESM_000069400 [Novymonas esmeraldas]|uniref:Thioesterase domain-containing protein n=1 Tax=Novymonas esmeraldas TaxID=1808958 RepID=A0AAW0F0R5_9TRYP
MADILSSPCWVKADDFAGAAFPNMYNLFVDRRDQHGGPFMRNKLNISSSNFHVAAVDPVEMPALSPTAPAPPATTAAAEATATPPPSSAKMFPYMVAVPFTVSAEVCDAAPGGAVPCMADGATSLLMDMVTSFHVMLACFPAMHGHVSLSIQANHMTPLQCGRTYLAISRIDKMGRRIVYTSVDYVEPQLQPVHDTTDAAPAMNTTAELLTAMKSATVLANLKHVKSILSSGV